MTGLAAFILIAIGIWLAIYASAFLLMFGIMRLIGVAQGWWNK